MWTEKEEEEKHNEQKKYPNIFLRKKKWEKLFTQLN